MERALEDSDGDCLDSIFCAVQAAWAWTQRERNFGVPSGFETEGWIADPATVRGLFNSSLTRVRPFFQALLKLDPTGRDWLPRVVGRSTPPVKLLRACLKTRRFDDRVAGQVELEGCFERRLPPPERFLRWLLHHPDRLIWPAEGKQRYSADTQRHRERLLGQHGAVAQHEAQELGLGLLYEHGATGSDGKWWAFEGFTEVDCCLETESFVLVVEGKRTETLSGSTSWYEGRNQLYRSLEAAREVADGRDYAVLLAVEERPHPEELGKPEIGLPHLESAERAMLLRHLVGPVTWRELSDRTGVPFESLPNQRSAAATADARRAGGSLGW